MALASDYCWTDYSKVVPLLPNISDAPSLKFTHVKFLTGLGGNWDQQSECSLFSRPQSNLSHPAALPGDNGIIAAAEADGKLASGHIKNGFTHICIKPNHHLSAGTVSPWHRDSLPSLSSGILTLRVLFFSIFHSFSTATNLCLHLRSERKKKSA